MGYSFEKASKIQVVSAALGSSVFQLAASPGLHIRAKQHCFLCSGRSKRASAKLEKVLENKGAMSWYHVFLYTVSGCCAFLLAILATVKR